MKATEDLWSQFHKAPRPVQMVWIAQMTKQPIGMSTWEECLEKHPEYFPEEAEHRRKWNSIPAEVKEAFFKELNEKEDPIYKEMPGYGKGLIYMISNPNVNAEYNAWQKVAHPKLEIIRKVLHEKHFKKYGI